MERFGVNLFQTIALFKLTMIFARTPSSWASTSIVALSVSYKQFSMLVKWLRA